MENASDKRLAIIARKVKKRRAELGMSQEKLAVKAGVSEDTVHRLEQCQYIQLYSLLCILDALGLELAFV